MTTGKNIVMRLPKLFFITPIKLKRNISSSKKGASKQEHITEMTVILFSEPGRTDMDLLSIAPSMAVVVSQADQTNKVSMIGTDQSNPLNLKADFSSQPDVFRAIMTAKTEVRAVAISAKRWAISALRVSSAIVRWSFTSDIMTVITRKTAIMPITSNIDCFFGLILFCPVSRISINFVSAI